MKKLIMCVALILILGIFLIGCKNSEAPSADETTELTEDTQETEELELSPQLFGLQLDDKDNFTLYASDYMMGFFYEIRDNKGRLMDEGYCQWPMETLEYASEDLLFMQYDSADPGQFRQKYFDVENGRVSKTFETPWGISDHLIAYFVERDKQYVLVVQDMFDPSTFYKEFTSDTFDKAIHAKRGSVEFGENNESITVNYYLFPNFEEATITFDLK